METSPTPAPAQSELNELRAQTEQLQQLVSSLLLILIVVSGTLSVFLLRQWRFAKAELSAMQPVAAQMQAEYTNSYAFTQDFARKLAEYGRTHPDFSNIASKYNLNSAFAKSGSASVTSSLPQSALPPK